MFGSHPRLPTDITMAVESKDRQRQGRPTTTYAKDLKQSLEEAYNTAAKVSEKTAKKSNGAFDQKVHGGTVG